MDLVQSLAKNAEENIQDAIGAITGKDTDSTQASVESFYVRQSHLNSQASQGSCGSGKYQYEGTMDRWYRPAYYYPWYYPTYSYPYYMPYYSSYPTVTVKSECPECENNITLELPQSTNMLLLCVLGLMILMFYKK